MKFVIQYFDSCPNWQIAKANLEEATGNEGTSIEYQRIETLDEAQTAGFVGSPTILIDGEDPFADERLQVGLSCRVYRTEHGYKPSPTVDELRQAIRRKR